MDKKYYLDDQGLIRVLQKISSSINEKTSSRINVTQQEDPETGEIVEEVQNPNNFATVGAVYNYIGKQSRKKLTIVKQSAVEDSENGYSVQNNVSEYNGDEAAEIRLDLIDNIDIQKLFITQ